MVALIGAPAHSVLLHQHEGGYKNPLHRDQHSKQHIRIRIKWLDRNLAGVDNCPDYEPDSMADHERHRTDEVGNRVPQLVLESALSKGLPFHLRNDFDIRPRARRCANLHIHARWTLSG